MVLSKPDSIVLVQLRAKKRNAAGRLEPAGSKAFSVTDIEIDELHALILKCLERSGSQ